MNPWPGEITSKQKEILKQFRQHVQDILKPKHDDVFLLRWLIARDFDLKKAEAMIRKSFNWRKQIGADTIQEDWEAPEVVKKYFTGGLCGFDKEGHPLWIDPFGYIDLKGICHSARKSDIIKYKVAVLEHIHKVFEEKSKELGKRVGQISLIFDVDKIGLRHMWKPGMDMFCDILTIFEDHYPETLKMNYIINAPKFFPVCYNIVKPFLSQKTISKVKICGSNWKEQLLKDIDASQLPVYWGGTMVDEYGDPRCTSKICFGGEVPQSYYLQNNDKLASEHMKSVVIGRASSYKVDIEVTEPGSAIRWEFFTEECDIGFGVFHKSSSARKKAGDMDVIIQTRRCNSHMVPEDGLVTCSKPGAYVIRFDNTYSWLKGKKLFYMTEVLLPDRSIPVSKSSHLISSFSSIPDEVYTSQEKCNHCLEFSCKCVEGDSQDVPQHFQHTENCAKVEIKE